MTLSKEQAGNIPAGVKASALSLFTNRTGEISRFLHLLHENQNTILFLYGKSGTGKSLLLKRLQSSYNKKLSEKDWQTISELSNFDLCKQYEEIPGLAIKSTLLDLGLSAAGKTAADPLIGLVMLYLDLARQEILLPTFRYAAVSYLRRWLRLDWTNIEKTFPQAEAGTPSGQKALAEAQLNLFILPGTDIEQADGEEEKNLSWYRRSVKPSIAQLIDNLLSETDLVDRLPEFLAKDLNTYVQEHDCPVVLFFDAHESFWSGNHVSEFEQSHRDLWLRNLLLNLALDSGIKIIVCGRKKPVWQDAPQLSITADHLELKELGGLSREDAADYLGRAGNFTAEEKEVLLRNARAGSTSIHPLYLALTAEALSTAREQNAGFSLPEFAGNTAVSKAGEQLSQSLLQYFACDQVEAIKALSACRSFTWDLANKLCQDLGFQLNESTYARILQGAFAQESNGLWRIHRLIQGILKHSQDKTFLRAHAFLHEYYKTQATETAELPSTLESIYHLNCLDWQAGLALFLNEYGKSLKNRDTANCRFWLAALNSLNVGSARAHVDVLQVLSQYFSLANSPACAMAVLLEARATIGENADDPETKEQLAQIYFDMAETAQDLHLHSYAIEYGTACASLCRELFDADRASAGTVMLGGQSLARLVDFYMDADDFDRAISQSRTALQFCSESKTSQPPYELALTSGSLLVRQGICYWKQEALDECIAHYTQALQYFDSAIACPESDERALINKCMTLASLATLHAARNETEQAGDLYLQALTCAEQSCEKAPESVDARTTKARLLIELADSFLQRNLFAPAEGTFAAGLIECEELQKGASASLQIYEIAARGTAGYARAQFFQKKYSEASESLLWAIERLNKAESIPGSDSIALAARKADMWWFAALCAEALSEQTKMKQLLQNTIKAYEHVIQLAPANRNYKQRLDRAQSLLNKYQTEPSAQYRQQS